jgi:AcrR family transcriptional regulator
LEVLPLSEESERLMQMFQSGFEQSSFSNGERQIMLHAIEVFSKKGFAGTKIKDIAQSAGFSQGYVYTYFKSKDDIFTRIVELASSGAVRAVQYAAKLQGAAMDRICWLTEAFLSPDSLAMQHWRLILLQSTASEGIPEEAKRIAKEKQAEPIQAFIPLLIEGQREGDVVEGDLLMLALAYFSMVQGVALARLQTSTPLPFPTVDVVLRLLRKNG